MSKIEMPKEANEALVYLLDFVEGWVDHEVDYLTTEGEHDQKDVARYREHAKKLFKAYHLLKTWSADHDLDIDEFDHEADKQFEEEFL